ncbi:pre-mRNA splicing helicase [Halarchaeum acidiphilum MH1-52-1]|uniref:Pre-mRNA splicing helicase n=1 Tax=Halarchaeum acidiphilum MH1-52-1 TaxID=1261545 RepID=U2YGP5_9EURY|nr:pre-mRNA splicing helicase [Halarchaeum acidiphilum MH1-52-1]
MGTVDDLDDVMAWLETTFYYRRAQSAPDAYDFANVRERVRGVLDDLVDEGFVRASDDLGLTATQLGVLTSTYYLDMDTAVGFRDLAEGDVDEAGVLRAVARSSEFESVSARRDEREAVASVLGERGDDLDAGPRKVLGVLYGAMRGSTPPELRSDAWIIRQNALRLLAALAEFLERFEKPDGANLAHRLEARIDTGVPAEAVELTALDGVGSGRAHRLVDEGLTSVPDVRDAGRDGLVDAGLSGGVADAVIEQAAALPDVSIDWGDFPDSVARGENSMQEVTVHNDGGAARVVCRVTATRDGGTGETVEMTSTTTYLDDATTLPVGVFGADDDALVYAVEVVFPESVLDTVHEERTVEIV